MRQLGLLIVGLSISALTLGCTDSDSNNGGAGGTAGMANVGGGSTTAKGGATATGSGGATAAGSGGSTTANGGSSSTGFGGSAGGIACGTAVCGAGQYCCNASCSICVPGGAACIQIACDTTGSAPCTTAMDCRLFDDYCAGCNCQALAQTAVDPTCNGTTVSCFAQPCMNKYVVCSSGKCTVSSS